MAVATSTTAIGNSFVTIANGGSYVTDGTAGYNISRDTVYGVPSDVWQRMPESERRFYAEKWQYEKMQERRYREDERSAELRRQMDEAPKVVKKLEPVFLTNTKLLLTEN